MADIFWHLRHAQARNAAGHIPNSLAISLALTGPLSHALQLDAANHRLHFHHAPVGADTFMQPAKAGGMLALIHRFPAFAVIFKAPHARPQLTVIHRDHATLTAGGHNFVLAKRPATDMPQATHWATFIRGAMSLSAILNHS